MFFDSWQSIGRIMVVGTLAYAALVLFLRVSKKRTLTQMNAFDLIVTVSLGSTLATVLLSKDVALADGLIAFVLLIVLQFIVSWLSVHNDTVRRLVKGEPTLLLLRGVLLDDALKAQRVTADEVRAAIRHQGISHIEEVEAVILETDGSFSVLPRSAVPASSVEPDVTRYGETE